MRYFKESSRPSRTLFALAALVLVFSAAAASGERGSRRMSGWFNAGTPDGWTGRRYMEGDEIFAEEFDSNGDGRIDVWRFYRRGVLTSEERDLGGDGKVNYQSRWDPAQRRLISVFRDTRWCGVNDLEIESVGRNRWEIREDRNQDGVADRILIVNGPPDLFERLGMDLSVQANVIDSIPVEYWYELQSDDGFTRSITDYRRYRRGEVAQYGQWDGQKVAWQKAPPDFTPPPSPPPADLGGPGPVVAGTGIDPARDSYVPLQPTGDAAGDPFADPFADPYAQGGGDVSAEPVGQFRAPTDRTRYEGLPPGESAARSLPARMRPPGANRR